MQAIRTDTYGPPTEVLSLSTIPLPPLSPNRLLIRVIAASTHAGDWHLIRGTPFLIRLLFGYITKPKIQTPGSDFAGIVHDVGEEVTDFQHGDYVFGDCSVCGFGAFAQFVSVTQEAIVKKPPHLSSVQAACVPTSALAALQALRDYAHVKEGDHVLVNGASGGVGSFAVQMARAFGARVTAVCRTDKVEKVRTLAADRVVDYTRVDVTKEEGVAYDVIIDTAAFRSPFDFLGVLQEGGRYVMVGGDETKFFGMLASMAWISATRKKKARLLESKFNKEDLIVVKDMLEEGSIVPLVDSSFSLEDVALAINYLEERKVCGKVAIEIQYVE